MPAISLDLLEASTRRKRELGISDESLLILSALSKGTFDQEELVTMCEFSIHVVRRTLKEFHNQGWVDRSEGSDDLRRRLFSLNPAGRSILDSLACQAPSIPTPRS
jgi:DNA-binding MarR family transcriptional regulator